MKIQTMNKDLKPPAASEHDTSKRKEEQNQQPVDLNLDLFDPDDEYSD